MNHQNRNNRVSRPVNLVLRPLLHQWPLNEILKIIQNTENYNN